MIIHRGMTLVVFFKENLKKVVCKLNKSIIKEVGKQEELIGVNKNVKFRYFLCFNLL